MTGNEIRRSFVEFFARQGHRVVRSSSLVPVGDPTLLFTNAGMNQFKDVFLGLEQRDYQRAVSVQKCVRAGGKHNDLENVGRTARHQTFFEMLGNFSFGDYFKKEAIAFAWELVAKEWQIPVAKLYFTVFGGAELSPGTTLSADEEAKKYWLEQGAPPDRVFTIPGLKDNFWAMGDTGPCGPCSEIFFDFGPAGSDLGHKDCAFPCDCGRYVEIWNLVFMQFNRDASGALVPLPKPSVDTGAGLERVAAVLQGKISNYDTDLLKPLVDFASELSGKAYGENHETDVSLRILADHSRAAAFLANDGVLPSNEGRGYVLRKIIRRACDHSRNLGIQEAFLYRIAMLVAETMNVPYPELLENSDRIARTIKTEEEKYARLVVPALREFRKQKELRPTRDVITALKAFQDKAYELYKQNPESFTEQEKRLFRELQSKHNELVKAAVARFDQETGAPDVEPALKALKDVVTEQLGSSELLSEKGKGLVRELLGVAEKETVNWIGRLTTTVSGKDLFYAYDTLGLRPEYVRDVVAQWGWKLSDDAHAEFEHAMAEQRERAKASWKGAHKEAAKPVYAKLAETFRTEPDFYYGSTARDCRIEAIVTQKGSVAEVQAGQEAEVVLDRTVFYAEAGGQVADVGSFWNNEQTMEVAEVRGAYYPVAGLIAHRILAKEALRVGDRVALVADGARREHIKRNHTGTHLLHAALRKILGTHVKQSGSLVAPDHLRFDFSHFAPVDLDELHEIEQQVNEEILRNLEIQTDVMPLDDALASGALAFFGDKYPEHNVRVVTIPDSEAPRGFYSKELCGGTHVRRTGDIGVFKITGEQSVAAGVRRVEAITGIRAIENYQSALASLRQLAATLNVGEAEVPNAVEQLAQATRQLEKQLEGLKRKAAHSKVDELFEQARSVKNVRVVSAQVEGVDREGLRQLVDTLRQKLGSGVVVLGATENGKVALISGVTKDLTSKLHAGKLIQEVAREVGGSGGGKPDLGEAGGKDTSALKSALLGVPSLVEQML